MTRRADGPACGDEENVYTLAGRLAKKLAENPECASVETLNAFERAFAMLTMEAEGRLQFPRPS